MQPETKQLSARDGFRESLEDVAAVLAVLSPHCSSWEQLNELVRLALENDAQLDFLLSVVTNSRQAKKR